MYTVHTKKEIEKPELSCYEKFIGDKFSFQFFALGIAAFIAGNAFFFGSGYDEVFTYFKFLACALYAIFVACMVSVVLYHNGLRWKAQKERYYEEVHKKRNPEATKEKRDDAYSDEDSDGYYDEVLDANKIVSQKV